ARLGPGTGPPRPWLCPELPARRPGRRVGRAVRRAAVSDGSTRREVVVGMERGDEWSASIGPGGIETDLDEELAEVLALEQTQEGPRSVLQSPHHVLPVLEPAFLQPAPDVAQELLAPALVVADQEALDQGPLDQQRHQVGARGRLLGVVLGNEPHQGMRAPRL